MLWSNSGEFKDVTVTVFLEFSCIRKTRVITANGYIIRDRLFNYANPRFSRLVFVSIKGELPIEILQK